MNKVILTLVCAMLISLSGCAPCHKQVRSAVPGAEENQSKWNLSSIDYPLFSKSFKIRTGYLEASPGVEFQGSVLYLQGLGDSMLNHDPFFSTLTQAGFRVIAFDYMGQGGSEGTMDNTRIVVNDFPERRISRLVKLVWKKHRRSRSDAPIVIGWSTGGLAAYKLAKNRWAAKVVLIAPGICVKGVTHTSFETLTSAAQFYIDNPAENPHVECIKPDSPLTVPFFGANLVTSSNFSRNWKIPSSVKGFVALSGQEDKYVNSQCANKVLRKNASHFTVTSYPDSLHEIDNEIPEIREKFYSDVLEFLLQK